MAGIVIIAHAPLASALKAVAEHAYPGCAQTLEVLDVEPDMSVEDVQALARPLLARVRSPDALLLTDIFGATPCNAALGLADGQQVKLVSGVNVPMLWRSLCYGKEGIDALVARATSGGQQGVMHVAPTRPQNQSVKTGSNDQNPTDDQ
jgi:mannose PTS system EIIA component